jgi:hypothetical protein
MSQSRQTHWIVAKHVLRYLRGTIGHGLRYTSSINMRLQGYTDSDWARSAVDKKSTSGGCFTLGSAMVSWCGSLRSNMDSQAPYRFILDMCWIPPLFIVMTRVV